jgi:Holliday junction resolvase RusA-like endonuclease
MTVLNYKPLSVNEVWQGRRFKTGAYKEYEKDLLYMLPKIQMPLPPYLIEMEFGMSALSDIDNPIKPFLDILQKKYGINDRYISTLIVKKQQVKKGKEFIKFKIQNESPH